MQSRSVLPADFQRSLSAHEPNHGRAPPKFTLSFERFVGLAPPPQIAHCAVWPTTEPPLDHLQDYAGHLSASSLSFRPGTTFAMRLATPVTVHSLMYRSHPFNSNPGLAFVACMGRFAMRQSVLSNVACSPLSLIVADFTTCPFLRALLLIPH